MISRPISRLRGADDPGEDEQVAVGIDEVDEREAAADEAVVERVVVAVELAVVERRRQRQAPPQQVDRGRTSSEHRKAVSTGTTASKKPSPSTAGAKCPS